MKYLDGLNEAQKQAVLHTEGPLLIVAGAGAGKTKTIVHRIAHLIEEGIEPSSILAVTFTNKAAGEMRDRVRNLLAGRSGGFPFVSTFHSLGVRLLREFHEEAGIVRGFSIWDRDDSLRAVKAQLKRLDTEEWTPRQILSAISREKGAGKTLSEYRERASSRREQAVALIWERYESTLAEEDSLDFDDLLVRTLALLRESQATLALLQNRWHYLIVDEYQDTSNVQYELMRLLSGERHNICVVGDLDQCLAAGTLITMADGTQRPIEAVKKGDTVLSNYGSGDMRSARVTGTSSKKTSSDLIRITTRSGRVLTSTPEHIHFAGYKIGLTPQLYFTYLMHKRGKGFRLGVSQVYTKGQRAPMIGFQLRCNHEHADKVWILAVHENPNEARILEYKLSLRYRIPTLPFVARKGVSKNGYVHDQVALDDIFASFDTEKSAMDIFGAYGLSRMYPHHRAQATTGGRRNIVVTLCGARRGKTAMHRISMAASDGLDREVLTRAGFSIRKARSTSEVAWRFESAFKNYGEVQRAVEAIQSVLPHAELVQVARLGGNKTNPKEGNSLPFLPAGSVLPGMVMFANDGGYELVEKVERIPTLHTKVFDLNVEHTHNFIANGIFTHNCIYTWRQAEIENLLSFERLFPNVKTVRLEQNYRSTRTIVAAANAVIEKNTNRVPKTLFSENATGDPIVMHGAMDERYEAWFVAERAAALIDSGVPAHEIAVLYRENSQSRVLEEALLHAGLPYRVLGTRFFERKEVKDVLSYLRAALNPKSRGDIARIVGVPARGIGKVTLDKMFSGQPLGAASVKVATFQEMLRKVRHAGNTLPTSEAVRYCIEASGIQKMYEGKTEEDAERLGNVRELANLAVKYEHDEPPSGIERLLEEAALHSEQDQLDIDKDKGGISLMTVHAAKGLEFEAVFVVGLEQGLFPSLRSDTATTLSAGESRDPEEERRLFYVALTRARKNLFLSYAYERSKYGTRESAMPSEFLSDIDERLLADSGDAGPKPKKRGLLDDYYEIR